MQGSIIFCTAKLRFKVNKVSLNWAKKGLKLQVLVVKRFCQDRYMLCAI